MLVAHTAYTTGGHLGDVCIIVHGEGLGVDYTLMIFFIELLEVSLSGRSGVVVDSLMSGLINYAAAVVRITIEEERCILKAEVSPVFAEDGVTDVGSAVFHCRMLFDELLDAVEVLVESLKLRIILILQNSGLDPECFVVVDRSGIVHISLTELRHQIYMIPFALDSVPLSFGVEVLNVRIIVPVLVESNCGACVYHLGKSSACGNEIGIVAACDHNAHSLGCGLTGQPGILTLSADLLCDDLLYFVVIVDLGAGNSVESGKFLDLAGSGSLNLFGLNVFRLCGGNYAAGRAGLVGLVLVRLCGGGTSAGVSAVAAIVSAGSNAHYH